MKFRVPNPTGEDVLAHISPQFVGDSTVRRMRTFVFLSATISSSQHEYRNVYYVPVEQRKISGHSNRIPDIPFEDSTTPTKVVLSFSENSKW